MKTDAQVIEEAKASVNWVEATTFPRHDEAGLGDIIWEKAQKHRLEITKILEAIEDSPIPPQGQIYRLCILNHYIENIKRHMERG